jgi:hypothetical protein
MIVLSIVTALALEHVAVSVQNRAGAAASRARIEVELASNLRELKEAEQTNRASDKQATALLRTLVDHLKAGKPIDPEVSAKTTTTALEHFGIEVPTLQRSAWESAIADQSAGHLAVTDLRRYSEIYAASADMGTTAQVLLGGEWLTRCAELLMDARLGKVDERNLANLLSRLLIAEQQIEASQEALSDLIAGHVKPEETTKLPPH